MKKYFNLLLCATLFFLCSCNKDEGIGGSSTLEGHVYEIRHWDKNYDYILDTIPAVDVRVQVTYGDNSDDFYGDDTRTDGKGMYGFNYLREGNYLISSYTEREDGQLESSYKSVKIKGKTTKAEDLYIHTTIKKGLASIKGSVEAYYYDKGDIVARGPAIEKRVFINVLGADTSFDDVRVGDQGYFVFTGIAPGKYEVWVTTEDPLTEKLTPIKKIIEVKEKNGVYEIAETFIVAITV